MLWISTVVPQPKWIARNDISYGVYIYAFPVQQMLAVFGLGSVKPQRPEAWSLRALKMGA
ncbi:hypothetical protein ACFWHR_12330 [Leucobacter sp. NPDC058333]|uniref:hypothetical protein n=1 Tax=Leucobacter sp. NPDC058333 TaxID=3346450 RepID=UPI00364FFBD9